MITLTQDQQQAEQEFVSFLANPEQPVMVLAGYSGTGKSTLLKYLLDNYNKYHEINKLLYMEAKFYEPVLTATTNKAAENLHQITGKFVSTIHSELGVRPETNMKGETKLNTNKSRVIRDALLIIDEASFLDWQMLKIIREHVIDSKILFVGDPAQLIPVKASKAAVFTEGYPTVELTEITRQSAGNPIAVVGDAFRKTVLTGQWPQVTPDGKSIIHMDRDSFEDATVLAFHKGTNAKVLAWTNKTVQYFNQALSQVLKGVQIFRPGDYARVNKYWVAGGSTRTSFKTDQLVQINDVGPEKEMYGLVGHDYTIGDVTTFCPNSYVDRARAMKEAAAREDWYLHHSIDNLIDLRQDFACTVNKSQGSTYDEVYIDLDDISKCNSGDTVARMLYVAITRARNKVVMTGDFA